MMETGIVNTPVQTLSALKMLIRNHRQALKKLSKARDGRTRDYWSRACEHWDIQIEKVIGTNHVIPPSALTMLNGLRQNIKVLSKEVDQLVVDDLLYRLDVVVETLVNDDLQKQIVKDRGVLKIEK